MSIYSEIKKVFPDIPIADISDYYTEEIEPAKNIYRGSPPWKRVKSSGIKQKSRDRSLLNMAKVVCDKMAALTYSEQCGIECSDEEYGKLITDTLERNAFNRKLPEWLSRAFALGGGELKINIIDSKILIDYLNADVFFPLKWTGKEITDGVFLNHYTFGGKFYSVFERYSLNGGNLEIDHRVHRSDSRGDSGTPASITELFPGAVQKSRFNGIKTPLFYYFKPAIGNNRVFDLPLGLPIFANCYDTLKEIDVVFDSLEREFILGKKRIILPEQMIQTAFDTETGEPLRFFDVDDEIYQAFTGDAEKMGITDITVQLRIQEHTDALKLLFQILSIQLGLSAGALSFDRSEGLKTATEVISDERDTMRTVQNQKNIVSEVIRELCEGIIAADCYIHGKPVREHEISVSWQDNVITDDDTRIKQNIELVAAALRSRRKALADINGYSDEDAGKELTEIEKETAQGGGTDSLFGDGE